MARQISTEKAEGDSGGASGGIGDDGVGVVARLLMRRGVWDTMLEELAVRGQGQRESGAFLLARVAEPHVVSDVVYYDDLDEDCLTGGISFARAGYRRLWQLCAEHGLRVCGDVHTHPGPGVMQSHTDATNPMISQAGHVAVIVPFLAQRPDARRGSQWRSLPLAGWRSGRDSLSGCGVHVYAGNHIWRGTTGHANSQTIVLSGRLHGIWFTVARPVRSAATRVRRALRRRHARGAR